MATTTKTNPIPVTEQPSVEELLSLLAQKEQELSQLRSGFPAAQPAPAPSAYREDAEQLKRRITIRLPIAGNKEPLFVRFGDETFTIRRGTDVSIPYYVWLHLQECQQADDALTLRMNDLSGAFASGVELYRL